MADTPNISPETAASYGYGPSDAFINSQAEKGQRTYDKQRYGRPQFQFPDISQEQTDKNKLLDILMGAGAGVQAQDGSQSPFASIAMGIGGGIKSVRDSQAQRQAAMVAAAQQQQDLQSGEMKLNEQQLDLAPLAAISPGLVQKMEASYGIKLGDMTLGKFKQISPMMQTFVKSQDAKQALMTNNALKKELANASPAIQALFEAQNGLPPGTLASLKTSEVGALKDQTSKPLSAELLKLKENANDGIKSLNNALAIFDKSGQATKTAAAYGGPGGDMARAMVGEQSQELRREILKATDVVTRIRTGAALNTQEQVFYSGLVNKVLQTNGQNRKSLVDLLSFYEKINNDIDSGKRSSGLAAIASDPKKLADLSKRLGVSSTGLSAHELLAPPAASASTPQNDPLGIR